MANLQAVSPVLGHTTKCDGCGLRTNSPELLHSKRKSFSLKRKLLCQACCIESLKYAQRVNWSLLAIAVLLSLLASIVRDNYGRLWLTLQLIAAILVISPLTIILHELGHAAVARLLRFDVYSITLGAGKLLWQGRAGDTMLQVRFIQFGGAIYAAPAQYGRWFPFQWFLIILAGPLANLFAALAGLIWAALRGQGSLVLASPLGFWIMINSVSFLCNLLPYKFALYGVAIGSDGLQLLWAMFRPRFLRERHEYFRPVSRFATYRQLGELEKARAVLVEKGNVRDDLLTLVNLSAIESELGNHKAAIAAAHRGLALLEEGVAVHPAVAGAGSKLLPKFFEAAFKDNLATAMLEEPTSDPQQALVLAREAYEILPFSPEVASTYGYALGLTGSPDKGLALMRKACSTVSDRPAHVQEQLNVRMRKLAELSEVPAP